MAPDRTAVLIIRAWAELHPTTPLRINIRRSTNVAAGFESMLTFTDADEVIKVVRAWLDDLQVREQAETDGASSMDGAAGG